MRKTLAQGAEAIITLKNPKEIYKNRTPKSYRIKKLDDKIRKSRTKSETKLLIKASKIIDSPVPKKTDEKFTITMPFIDGKKLSEHLDNFPLKQQCGISKLIGKQTAKLHSENLIHGDLTTSNLIFKNEKVFFIDFGLGFHNGKYEDKAVDIHLFKQALESKHFKNWKTLFEEFKKGYYLINNLEAEKVFQRLNKVEKRGRYKH